MYNEPHQHHHISVMGDSVTPHHESKSVYLKGVHNTFRHPAVMKVAPAFNSPLSDDSNITEILKTMKPFLTVLRLLGVLPMNLTGPVHQVTTQWMIYSVALFTTMLAYIGYLKYDEVEIVRSAEGRFEEAVIDYLFSVYLVPILLNPIVWYQSRKQAKVLTDFFNFEKLYNSVTNKRLSLFVGNKPMMITIGLPLLSCGTMVVTHVTMVHFKFLQVIPYCYINTITYVIGGSWFIFCDIIGKTATVIAEDFQLALKHVGPSAKVAEYRSMWMMLSKITTDVGHSFGYALTFLCMYLFLIITLTIYGLLSQIQEGFGIKDVGLTVTAVFAIALLFFVCDEAHYASSCVRVYFQKKLLLVELSWMNDDAQEEVNMFLRATEMNSCDMSLGGFFDVNRNLFKSLLATMVTYLVVLLQFQISIPEDTSGPLDFNSTYFTAKPM